MRGASTHTHTAPPNAAPSSSARLPMLRRDSAENIGNHKEHKEHEGKRETCLSLSPLCPLWLRSEVRNGMRGAWTHTHTPPRVYRPSDAQTCQFGGKLVGMQHSRAAHHARNRPSVHTMPAIGLPCTQCQPPGFRARNAGNRPSVHTMPAKRQSWQLRQEALVSSLPLPNPDYRRVHSES
jgi:hypothetical protein